MSYSYKQLYQKSAAFFEARPKAKKALSVWNTLLTGLFALAYVALWVYAVGWSSFVAEDYIRITFIPLLTLFLVSILRAMIARPRPYSKKGDGITPLEERNGNEEDSFPSRHLACAMAIVLCFFPALPIVGAALAVCVLVLAWLRFALGLHYPSDLLAGGAVALIVSGFYYIMQMVFAYL